ncbi:hypothetical protein [Streptomyces sp. NPDC056480]|uniref:hypothetical protein n=1 Tax=Streptomyces sp. NPDC056480 TaxID=3345833 RepID=UPI0036872510
MLLWVYCKENDQNFAQILISHTVARLGQRTVHAYSAPTPLAPAGLPMRQRPDVRRALENCGFSVTDEWLYLHHRLDTLRPCLYAIADVSERPDGSGWQLYLRERDGTHIGEARVNALADDIVALDWLALDPSRRPLGHVLLEQCLKNLADRGVHHVVTCLAAPDDHRPQYEEVIRLHETAGFIVADQLNSYTRCP